MLNTVASTLSLFGVVACGLLADRYESRRPRIRPWTCCIVCLMPLPFLVLVYATGPFWLCMLGLFGVAILGEGYISVAMSMLMNVATPSVRALQSASVVGFAYIGASAVTVGLGTIEEDQTQLRGGLIGVSLGAIWRPRPPSL